MTSWLSATFTLINLQLGTGPLILPSPFLQAGFVLSIAWFLLIGVISYITAEYVVESLCRTNYYLRKNDKAEYTRVPGFDKKDKEQGGVADFDKTDQMVIHRPMEMGEIAAVVSGRTAQIIITATITFFMLGIVISKFIMTGNTMAQVFRNVPGLNSMQVWLGLFFVSVAVFSFGNIQETRILQLVIVIARGLSILFMVGGALYLIAKYGSMGLAPRGYSLCDFRHFPELFSNTLLAMMCHNNISKVLCHLRPGQYVHRSLMAAFAASIVSLVFVPMTGIMAFGGELVSKKQGDLKLYNENFKEYLPEVYYFVSFYIFLNVAALPVLVITIRHDLLKLFAPHIDSRQFSRWTVLTTLLILTGSLLLALFTRNYLEYVLVFSGGVCGVLSLLIYPSYLVIKTRAKTPEIQSGFTHEACIPSAYLPYILLTFGFVSFGYSLVQAIFTF